MTTCPTWRDDHETTIPALPVSKDRATRVPRDDGRRTCLEIQSPPTPVRKLAGSAASHGGDSRRRHEAAQLRRHRQQPGQSRVGQHGRATAPRRGGRLRRRHLDARRRRSTQRARDQQRARRAARRRSRTTGSSRRSSTSGASSSTTTWISPSRRQRAARRSTSRCRRATSISIRQDTGTQCDQFESLALRRDDRHERRQSARAGQPDHRLDRRLDGLRLRRKATADSLRTFVGGKLRTSAGNLPPTDAAGNFLAGDVRANENIELTSMHALFVREHNRWADADRPAESAAHRRGDLPAGPRDRDRRDPGRSPTTSSCRRCWAPARSIAIAVTIRPSIRASPTSFRRPRSACTA